MIYTVIVEEDDNGDACIPLPAEFLKESGWDETTELDISITSDNKVLIRKLTEDEK